MRHAAIAEALASLGIRVVVGVGSVGALTASCPPGRAVVPSDYFNLWGIESGLRDEGAHISPQYDASVRALLADVAHVDAGKRGHMCAASRLRVDLTCCRGCAAAQVVYVQTRGPRFETPAEVRFLATLGDVVGMTGAHEACRCISVCGLFCSWLRRRRICRSAGCATRRCAWWTTGPTGWRLYRSRWSSSARSYTPTSTPSSVSCRTCCAASQNESCGGARFS